MLHPLMSRLMDPVHHLCYDWMHIFFVSGIFNVHVGCMMNELKPHKITYNNLNDYLQMWKWPIQVGVKSGRDACSAKRANASWSDGTFKVQASEGRSVAPVLAHFVSRVIVTSEFPVVRAHGQCFMLLVAVLVLIEKVSRGTANPSQLQAAISTYLAAFKRLYGEDNMIIKFHYAMHLPAFLARWVFLPNCFVLERKHRVPKRFANHVMNTECNWDACVLRELTNYRVHHLTVLGSSHFQVDAELVDPRQPRPALLQQLQAAWGQNLIFRVSRCARINQHEKIYKGDVFLAASGVIGCALMHFSIDVGDGSPPEIMTHYHEWGLLADQSEKHRKAQRRSGDDRTNVLFTDEIKCGLCHAGGDVVTCLYPFRVL